MTREEFINEILRFCSGRAEAENIASDYTDEEIKNEHKGIIDEIREEFRFCVVLSHYRNCGY